MKPQPNAGAALARFNATSVSRLTSWVWRRLTILRWFLLPWALLALLGACFPTCQLRFQRVVDAEVIPSLPPVLVGQFLGGSGGLSEREGCDEAWEQRQLARLAMQPVGLEDAESRRFLSHAIARLYYGGHSQWPQAQWEKVLAQKRPEQALLNSWEVFRFLNRRSWFGETSSPIPPERIRFFQRCVQRGSHAAPQNGFPVLQQLGLELSARNGGVWQGLQSWTELRLLPTDTRNRSATERQPRDLDFFVNKVSQQRLFNFLKEAGGKPDFDAFGSVINWHLHQDAMREGIPDFWMERQEYSGMTAWPTDSAICMLVTAGGKALPFLEIQQQWSGSLPGPDIALPAPTITLRPFPWNFVVLRANESLGRLARLNARLLAVAAGIWMVLGVLVIRAGTEKPGGLGMAGTAFAWITLAGGLQLGTSFLMTNAHLWGGFASGYLSWEPIIIGSWFALFLAWLWSLKPESQLRQQGIASLGVRWTFPGILWVRTSPEAILLLSLLSMALMGVLLAMNAERLPDNGVLQTLVSPSFFIQSSLLPGGTYFGPPARFLSRLSLCLATGVALIWVARLRFGCRDGWKRPARNTLRLWRDSFGVVAIVLSWFLCLNIAAGIPLERALNDELWSRMQNSLQPVEAGYKP